MRNLLMLTAVLTTTGCGDDEGSRAPDTCADAARVWYLDADGDGFGVPLPTLEACDAPAGWAATADDCDDAAAEVHPGATEVCGNGLDDDCDGAPGACRWEGEWSAESADVELSGPSLGAAGRVVRVADLVGDAAAEVVVGVPSSSGDPDCASAVYLPLWPYPSDRVLLESSDVRICDPADDQTGGDLAIGDFDGDGVDDLAVGAPNEAFWNDAEGLVVVFYGPLPVGRVDWWDAGARISGGVEDFHLGSSLSAGDFNGDGTEDLAVASYTAAVDGLVHAGSVSILYGPIEPGASLSAMDATSTLTGSVTEQYFGYRLRTVPDADGDGADELLVGAPLDSTIATRAGAAYVFAGISDGVLTDQSADFGVFEYAESSWFGYVAAAGDLDGDGLGDLVLGNAETGDMSGAALVYFAPWSGTVDTDPAQADAAVVGTEAGGRVGYSVEVADVDGDGQSDLLVGALSWDGDLGQAGVVGVFYGPIEPGQRGLGDADALFVGTVDAAYFGDGEPRAGDVNGDGVPDLVLPAPMEDAQSTNSDNGVVRVFYGAGF